MKRALNLPTPRVSVRYDSLDSEPADPWTASCLCRVLYPNPYPKLPSGVQQGILFAVRHARSSGPTNVTRSAHTRAETAIAWSICGLGRSRTVTEAE